MIVVGERKAGSSGWLLTFREADRPWSVEPNLSKAGEGSKAENVTPGANAKSKLR